MEAVKATIDGILIIKPKVYEDARGCFFEPYNKDAFTKIGIDAEFVQDNQSLSENKVLRGLHFQNPPYAQGKLIRVIKGSVLDVAVDIRKNSPTYGQHLTMKLTEQNHTMLWIPEGFAHGFLTLENDTMFAYKCTQVYNKESEDGILWNDPDLNIDWNVSNPLISEKDKNAQRFKSFKSLF